MPSITLPANRTDPCVSTGGRCGAASGTARATRARLRERGSGPHGPVTVYGTIDGYPAVANAFGHLLFVRHGKPPVGAIPRKPGDRHVFFRGSEVTIGLVTP